MSAILVLRRVCDVRLHSASRGARVHVCAVAVTTWNILIWTESETSRYSRFRRYR